MEYALCNDADRHPLVAEFYAVLRALVRDTCFAGGAGDLRSPAAPRYTECWITTEGLVELAHLDSEAEE